MKSIIAKIKNKFSNEEREFLNTWERERAKAEYYGHAHVKEIDAIFSRHVR
jgi:hypothetical protein